MSGPEKVGSGFSSPKKGNISPKKEATSIPTTSQSTEEVKYERLH
jgi:hypothetical protein